MAAPSASQLRDAGGSSILCLDSLQQLQLQGAHPLSWTEHGRSHPEFLRPHPAGDRCSSSPSVSLRVAGFGQRLCRWGC